MSSKSENERERLMFVSQCEELNSQLTDLINDRFSARVIGSVLTCMLGKVIIMQDRPVKALKQTQKALEEYVEKFIGVNDER